MARAPYPKRFVCIDCDVPVGHSDARCPACRQVFKAAWNMAYQRRYHAANRPAPAPTPQRRGDLPPLGMLVDDDAGARIQCQVCGAYYGALASHVRAHGPDAARYKERYELARGSFLLSPQTAEKFRQRALERNQGAKGVPFGPSHEPIRQRGIPNRLQSRIAESKAH